MAAHKKSLSVEVKELSTPPSSYAAPASRPAAPTTITSSAGVSLRSPRTTRFAEATSVISPVEPATSRTARGVNFSTFHGAPIITSAHVSPTLQPVHDGYAGAGDSKAIRHTSVEMPLTPCEPLRSALRVPGTPGRFLDPRSPTFREEVALEKEELKAEHQNASDLVSHPPSPSLLFLSLSSSFLWLY